MRILWRTALGTTALVASLFAGALVLQIGNPAVNPEALAKNAVLVARITACHSPEKVHVTATAEGIVDGSRQSIPLNVISLSSPGTFAVTREWPHKGAWVVKMVATNPDYKNYATGVLVPAEGDTVRWTAAKQYFRAPTPEDIAAVLENRMTAAVR
jgi:hypothetical protein